MDATQRTPQHTPGPWHIATTTERNWGGETITNRKICTLMQFKHGSQPCELALNSVGDKYPEAAANARLIAAAPELLEALLQAVARVELANDEGDPILSAWMPEARAAIAKATGGAA